MRRKTTREIEEPFLPGFEPEPENGNGKRARVESGQGGAEAEVPPELVPELELRKWHPATRYTGPWHNTIHYGNNMDTLRRMPEGTVDLILTDPPYAINYRSNRRVKQEKFKHLANDHQGDWIDRFAVEAYRVLKRNRHLYCFCRHDTYPVFIEAFKRAGFKLKRTLIWVKNNHGSGDLKGDYAPQDEWIIYAHKGRRELFGKRDSNVILGHSRLPSRKLTHSTEKPVSLLKYLIGKSTRPGELVLDPFSGSGSTMHAAIEMERAYCMIELSDQYYLTTVKRSSELQQGDMFSEHYRQA
ncbi:MAG TPA: hypothetical protein ENI92_04920 [Bacteroidetes bacterium]|nr:hypothetical protein [Bacteroidota bacterium]